MGRIKVLNVAEKPSVASAIVSILSKGESNKKKSYSKYNPVFTFDYKMENETWSMFVTSVTGHLTDQKFDDKYKNWNNTDPHELFDAKITIYIDKDKKPIENNLKKYSKDCNVLILWLDCDREGEHICFEVINACSVTNKKLKIHRAQFSAVTEKDIKYAINNLKSPNKNLAQSVDVRREIDLRMGSIFTRFMTIRYFKLVQNDTKIISYGPCQFPTLGFVVNRYLQIKNFNNEYYWTIKMGYLYQDKNSNNSNLFLDNIGKNKKEREKKKKKGKKKKNCSDYYSSDDDANNSYGINNRPYSSNTNYVVDFTWSRLKLFDHLGVVLIYEDLLKNPLCRISNIFEKEVKKYRPFPLNTLQMTKLVSKYFHISSKECMNIAEKLYSKGYISYPRTETNYFVDSMNLRKIIHELKKNNIFGNYATKLAEKNSCKPRKGKLNDKAHPPIHPVKNMNKANNVDFKEWKIYEFICRHFLAVCSDDAIGFDTKVVANIGEEQFYCKGLKIKNKNYLEIYIYEKWNDKILPPFQINDEFYPYSLVVEEGITQPPKYLSESDLLSLMDKYGIGTDATMHEHIENIQKRNYVYKNSKNLFIPTKLGIALILSYKKFKDIGVDLTEPSLRAKMERDMFLVASGEKGKNEIIRNYIDIMKYIYQEIYNRIDLLDENINYYINNPKIQS
ncbi:DNA topoisomerase 3, putative [Plasmodium berghei]|uniref:DNA topoisomerase n=2 Tax=Plasmodium berghei TaxID=5821 RepID=A0A509AQY8_PLABA|nr:DNA topoisomerase 3, putative [Plasmodium berghei ANKA]CXJ04484.1 DNA topoisomerase 3, putative [Plasmodium berghei]SCL98668.1 DNA topoisomerase 3, putative [Plasmodium berghei]SCM18671.1 DNA topoisomerase 3, putative [Plasmodium berghei]SCN28106.1 DNA topoisomerase 3, putative [Plasmodium berghei]VUC57987.1 DNA topoisomerase 3, putative [Plasmodium berghei ANKA]|eukprot:XP_034423756.1 DNA topoisomerase 3, putative [Plasmodium berghei ANKA]